MPEPARANSKLHSTSAIPRSQDQIPPPLWELPVTERPRAHREREPSGKGVRHAAGYGSAHVPRPEEARRRRSDFLSFLRGRRVDGSAGDVNALGGIAVSCRMVSAAVGDARDGLDAEIAVTEREVPGQGRCRIVDVDAVVARADRDVSLQQRVGGCGLDEQPIDRRASDQVPTDRVPDRRRPPELLEGGSADARLIEAQHGVALDHVAGPALERDAEAALLRALTGAGEPVSDDGVPVARDDDAVLVVREAVVAELVSVPMVEEDPGLGVA